MRILYVLLVAVFVLGVNRPVQAADLFTGPLGSVNPSGLILCRLANVSTASRTVRIQVVDASGTLQADSGDFPLAAGQVGLGGFPNSGTWYYCHFTVQGNKDNVRGSIAFSPDGVIDTAALPAE